MLSKNVEPGGQTRRQLAAQPAGDPPHERDRQQHERNRHDADRQLVVAADGDRQRVEPVAQRRLVLGHVAIENVAARDAMPDVGVGRLVTVERLAGADRRGPEVDAEPVANLRPERVRTVPDVEHQKDQEHQARPAHRETILRASRSSRNSARRAQSPPLVATEDDTDAPGRRSRRSIDTPRAHRSNRGPCRSRSSSSGP